MRNSQLNGKNSLIHRLAPQSKSIHVCRPRAAMHNRRLPVAAVHLHIAKSVCLAGVGVEARAPWQAGVRAAPAGAEVPGAGAAVQHVLIHTRVVGGLQTGPEIVGRRGRKRGHDHGARELGELGAAGRVVGQEVPCDSLGLGGQEGKEEGGKSGFEEHLGCCLLAAENADVGETANE